MSEKKLLIAFLGKTLNIPGDKVAESLYQKADDGTLTEDLNDNALDNILALDKDRVKNLRSTGSNSKEHFDNGYSKGKKESLENFESGIRKEFGIDNEKSLQGMDLVKQVLSSRLDDFKKDELSPDKIKMTSTYLDLENKVKTINNDWQQKFDQETDKFNQQISSLQTKGILKGRLETSFASLNPVLSPDPAKAKRRTNNYLDSFINKYEWKSMEDGSGHMPMLNGKRVEDDHGNALSIDELLQKDASLEFDFQVQDPKGNAGNDNKTQSSSSGTKTEIKPENFDVQKYLDPSTTAEERAAMAGIMKKE